MPGAVNLHERGKQDNEGTKETETPLAAEALSGYSVLGTVFIPLFIFVAGEREVSTLNAAVTLKETWTHYNFCDPQDNSSVIL